MDKKLVTLIVLDGWGYRAETKDNAIAEANTPYYDYLWSHYPHSLLAASGEAVGLPEGQMGNSEVGHMTIGAGRPIATDLVRINKDAEAERFGDNPVFQKLFAHVVENNSALHLLGLIGPGGVHAMDIHLLAILRAAKTAGLTNVLIHAFTDGRDTPPQSAAEYLSELENKIKEIGVGRIASVCGRYCAMDRDNNWDRIDKTIDMLFTGTGRLSSEPASHFVEELYEKENAKDEHLLPIVFADEAIKNGDAIFFFNFRPDRARQLSRKINEAIAGKNILFGTMTGYEPAENRLVAYAPLSVETTLPREVAKAGLTQTHIAETEKFAHATYFFNGGSDKRCENETDILIDSRKDIATHDQAPEMRANEIADKAVEILSTGSTDFMFINFANADMVGHTANHPAILKAVECVDANIKKVVEATLAQGGVAIITADHGNAEMSVDPETGINHTSHTTDPVPFIITKESVTAHDGGLADLAPTVLKLLELKKPDYMTGSSLFD